MPTAGRSTTPTACRATTCPGCAPYLACVDGTCAAGPGEGEPCADFGCGANLYCDNEICVGFEPLLCSSFGL